MPNSTEAEAEAEESGAVGETTNALTTLYGGEVELPARTWADIGPTFLSACFLTRIGGKFEGGAEWGQVANEGGRWIVRAHSQQVCDVTSQARCPLFATARCVALEYSATGSWQKGNVEKFLQKGGSCFLTRVMGKFVGGGESVLVYQRTNGDWYIKGTSGTPENIGASAACVQREQIIAPVTKWAADTWSVRSIRDPDPTTKACFLQGVQGGMRGGNEEVATSNSSGTVYWYLSGSSTAASSKHMIGATMGCIGGNDVPLP